MGEPHESELHVAVEDAQRAKEAVGNLKPSQLAALEPFLKPLLVLELPQ